MVAVKRVLVHCSGEGENGQTANGKEANGAGQNADVPHLEAVNGYHGNMMCEKCEKALDLTKPIVNYNGQSWHPECFV